jgi:hypothetical protein
VEPRKLPSHKFHRQIGMWSTVCATPDGALIDRAEFEAKKHAWLPSAADENYIKSLMHAVTEPGKMASWVAPPAKGHQRPARRVRVRAPGRVGAARRGRGGAAAALAHASVSSRRSVGTRIFGRCTRIAG